MSWDSIPLRVGCKIYTPVNIILEFSITKIVKKVG